MHRRAYVTWRAAGLSQRDGHRPLIDSPRLDELPRVLLFPPRLPSSETRRRNRRSKLGGGAGRGERGGEGSLSLDKAKRWTSCQVTRNSSKQESIPSEIHTYTFPTDSSSSACLSFPAISKRRPLESAENTLRPQHLDYANYDGLSSELGKRGRRSASTASTSHVATRRKRKFGLPLPRRPSRNSKPEGSRLRGISEFRMLGF